MKDLSSKNLLVINVLKFLMETGDRFVSTTELFKRLVSGGVLENSKADRKKLQRILSELAESGFLIKRFSSFKGKKPQEWKINLDAFPYFLSCSTEEILSLFVLISFVPKQYRDMPVLQPALKAMNRLGRLLDEEKRKIAIESFDYCPIPIERYSVIDRNTLESIFIGIIERKKLLVSYRNSTFEIYPIKLFNYNGIFYLSAVDAGKHNYITLKLVNTKVHRIDDERFPSFYHKRYRNRFFAFPEEPFVLKVELPADYMSHLRPEHNIFHYPTQFHMEFDDEKVLVWLVGFTSYRFASWIILDEIKAFYPPDEESLKLAKEKKINEVYEDFTLSLSENYRRYEKFCDEIKRFFRVREHLLKFL